MRNKAFIAILLLLALGVGFLFFRVRNQRSSANSDSVTYLPNFDATRAANYLDTREAWWQTWPPAQQPGGAFCISCHTALPYALARPQLRKASGATQPTPQEKLLTDSIEKRVANWAQAPPWYSDHVGPGKAAQSRATEAVVNAVVLTAADTRQGHLRPITRSALHAAWELQQSDGGWKWQDFQLAPWESGESAYQGAALLAEKVQAAPDGYAGEADVRPLLNRTWEYLHRGYSSQSVLNKLYVLWASSKSTTPLSPRQRESLLHDLRRLQQSDGGWSLARLDAMQNGNTWPWLRKRLKVALQPPPSDGCATGLVVLVLQQAGLSRQDPMLLRGVQWLRQHQTAEGSWRASSLNTKRNPETGVGRFMSDAATGFAVIALEEAQ